jgi:hypothetical protein
MITWELTKQKDQVTTWGVHQIMKNNKIKGSNHKEGYVNHSN